MSTLCKVVLPNPYFSVGDFLESSDGSVQKVEVRQQGGRLLPGKYVGLAVPENLIRPYIFKILSKGFDDKGAHAEMRNAYEAAAPKVNKFWEEFGDEEDTR